MLFKQLIFQRQEAYPSSELVNKTTTIFPLINIPGHAIFRTPKTHFWKHPKHFKISPKIVLLKGATIRFLGAISQEEHLLGDGCLLEEIWY